MTPEELCKKLGGTKSLNRMKAHVNGKLTIIARLNGHTYEFTDEGAAQAAKLNAESTVGLGSVEEKTKVKRKLRTPKVEADPEPQAPLFTLPEEE
jgi:hypothetical protein